MYSIVLMAAMTTGGDVAACHNCSGCHGFSFGCCGCQGYNHGCCGCHGYSHGCCGCFGGCFKHHNSCCGCCGTPVCCAPTCCEKPACNTCNSCGTCDSCGSTPAVEEKKEEEGDDEEMKKESKAVAPAKLIVRLPATSKLTIDGAATKKSASARRTFVSPKLAAGKVYTYTVQAEINGQTVSKTVDVRAGETTTVELAVPATVASR